MGLPLVDSTSIPRPPRLLRPLFPLRGKGLFLHRKTVLLVVALVTGCGAPDPGPRTAGDPKAGRAAIERYQCGVCHDIPGVAQAEGTVGPPLTAYSRRVYIAGKLPQDSALLARWIRDAPSLAPATAMPATGVTEAEALDIVAYLYRLH